jgi:hypothetical protein
MKPLLIVASLALLLSGTAVPALCETIVLDGDDVSDWARALSTYSWKHKDACLYPHALLKFDLSQVPTTGDILAARLDLFVERVTPGAAIRFTHVQDDSWSYGWTPPDALYNWPEGDLIAGISFQDTTSLSLDVTQHVLEDLMVGDRTFSLKITGDSYPDIRISSPLAPLWRMRPRLVVDFLPPPVLPPSLPDLAASDGDIRLAPVQPQPGQQVMVRATVRNLGAAAAQNVEVLFYDGPPSVGQAPFGTWIIALLPGGGGSETTYAPWTAQRGLHEIYIVVDPRNLVAETDEDNNADFRTFFIADAPAHTASRESFEYPGMSLWHSDFDVPKPADLIGPKSFYINQSGGESYDGTKAMELYLDGTSDDGTIWLERAIPVEPWSTVNVAVDFELFRYLPDIAFQPVVAIGTIDPEVERDFTVLPEGPHTGWWLHSYERTFATGPYDMIHVAVGLTVTWETPGTFYLDLVQTRVTDPASGVGLGADREAPRNLLYQNTPNPAGPATTIAYNLDREGPVSLRIFSPAGELVTTLFQGRQQAGFHRAHWNGQNASGRALANGVYLYRLETTSGPESRKLLLLR